MWRMVLPKGSFIIYICSSRVYPRGQETFEGCNVGTSYSDFAMKCNERVEGFVSGKEGEGEERGKDGESSRRRLPRLR